MVEGEVRIVQVMYDRQVNSYNMRLAERYAGMQVNKQGIKLQVDMYVGSQDRQVISYLG